MLNNLNAFVVKWINITDSSGSQLVTPSVMKEIDHLKIHINRGCLSDIPPSFGTSKNENLDRSLNARFSRNKLGVEVAVAILATFFTCRIVSVIAVTFYLLLQNIWITNVKNPKKNCNLQLIVQ